MLMNGFLFPGAGISFPFHLLEACVFCDETVTALLPLTIFNHQTRTLKLKLNERSVCVSSG